MQIFICGIYKFIVIEEDMQYAICIDGTAHSTDFVLLNIYDSSNY